MKKKCFVCFSMLCSLNFFLKVFEETSDEESENEEEKQEEEKLPSSVNINVAQKTHDGTTSSITSAIGMNSTSNQIPVQIVKDVQMITQWDLVLKQFIKDNFFKHVSLCHCCCSNDDCLVQYFSLYPTCKVKFITKAEKLNYYDPVQFPNTFCAFIIKGINLPPDINPENWWNTFGKARTKERLTKLRNDKIVGLKWAYYGNEELLLLVHCLT